MESLGVVVHVAVVGGIGKALCLKLLDDVDDLRDVLGGLRVDGRALDAQRIGVLIVLGDEALAQFLDGDAFLVGAADHLIVDIGEVLNELDLIALVLKVAAKRVEHDERARIADVEIVVDGRAAGIDAHLARLNRDEFFLAAGLCVINLHVQVPPSVAVFHTACAGVLPVHKCGVQAPRYAL